MLGISRKIVVVQLRNTLSKSSVCPPSAPYRKLLRSSFFVSRCSLKSPVAVRSSLLRHASDFESTKKGQDWTRDALSFELARSTLSRSFKSISQEDQAGKGQTSYSTVVSSSEDDCAAKVGVLQMPRKEKTRWSKNFQALSKTQLSTWVALSTLPGYLVCYNPSALCLASSLLGFSGINTILTVVGLAVGTFLCSASANTFNQIFERRQDKIMTRTRARPLPSGDITLTGAKKFGICSGVAGVTTLLLTTNPLTGAIAAVNIGLYTLLYTPLKMKTPYNTHVGAVVGSIPILLGATAASSFAGLLSPQAWMLFAVQTLWQFPHFYSLAWLCREDYKSAGYKMWPIQDKTGYATAKMIRPYVCALTALPLASSIAGISTYMFAIDSLPFNAFIYFCLRKFEKNPSQANSRSFFLHSLWHLFALLGLGVYHALGTDQEAFYPHGVIKQLKNYLEPQCVHNRLKGFQDNCPLDKNRPFLQAANSEVQKPTVS